MNSLNPFFSICIPTYEMNGLGKLYLRSTFEILSNQTFTNFEVIISDHSKDNSIEDLCIEFKNSFDIKYIRYKVYRGSSSANINSAIKNASGHWIKVLFQDDYLDGSNALKIIFDQINNSDGGWLVCACQHTNDGLVLFDSHFPRFHPEIHLGENTIGAPSNIAFKNQGSVFLIGI